MVHGYSVARISICVLSMNGLFGMDIAWTLQTRLHGKAGALSIGFSRDEDYVIINDTPISNGFPARHNRAAIARCRNDTLLQADSRNRSVSSLHAICPHQPPGNVTLDRESIAINAWMDIHRNPRISNWISIEHG